MAGASSYTILNYKPTTTDANIGGVGTQADPIFDETLNNIIITQTADANFGVEVIVGEQAYDVSGTFVLNNKESLTFECDVLIQSSLVQTYNSSQSSQTNLKITFAENTAFIKINNINFKLKMDEIGSLEAVFEKLSPLLSGVLPTSFDLANLDINSIISMLDINSSETETGYDINISVMEMINAKIVANKNYMPQQITINGGFDDISINASVNLDLEKNIPAV